MPEADIRKELQQKICVLEVAQKAKIHHNTGDHQRFPDSRTLCPVDQIREIIIDRRRQHQQQKIEAARFVQEVEGKEKQIDRSCFFVSVNCTIHQKKCEKEKEEHTAVENHR